jgi:uncharacterized protein (TIGR00251 family)
LRGSKAAMIDLQVADGGVIVPVRAQPKARRNAIVGTHAGRLRIVVTDPPEKGKANKSIAEILATALKIAPSRVQLVAGGTSPQKKFLVAGLPLAAVRELLMASLASEP